MDQEKVTEVTEQLERAEDDFLRLVERFPHLIKEPEAFEIIRTMRHAIVVLASATRPSSSRPQ